MNASYTIRREAEGLPVPFGIAGVAGAGAILLGLVGLIVPIGWVETLSYQLYLDTITSAAAPPLGTTARILFALALAALGGAAGYVLARLFNVVPSDLVDVLLTRLRGLDRDDEADAPVLRSADRHPDAPARRPFSPLRDIPEPDDADAADMAAASDPVTSATGGIAEEDDELLLDGQFAGPPEPVLPARVIPETHDGYDAAGWPIISDDAQEHERMPAPAMTADTVVEGEAEEAAFDLPAPAPEDWEVAAQPVPEPEAAAESPAQSDAPVAEPVMVQRPAAAQPQPLDLSAARLDELIARLEAGFARKTAAPAAFSPDPASLAAEPASVDGGQREPAPGDDPAFPHDPALAAALATLRKLNRAG